MLHSQESLYDSDASNANKLVKEKKFAKPKMTRHTTQDTIEDISNVYRGNSRLRSTLLRKSSKFVENIKNNQNDVILRS